MMSLFVSVATISGLSGFLAVLMVIADATIANYGILNVTINGDKKFEVKGGRPLLGTLMDEGVFIPSACGGRGSCGLCKVKVTDGAGALLPTELPWLSEDEKSEGVRLACQCKVKNDFAIEIPEELFNVKEYRTSVASIRDLTHDIKEVVFKLEEPNSIEYKAGQFIQLKVPAYELTDEPVYRAYSMASHPDVKDRVEAEIRLVPNGICTTYVHKHLKEGDEVILNGPYGEFFLRDSDRRIVCIAGGSGMAPIKSILNDMAVRNIDRETMYFFGARSKRDLFLLDEMEELEKRLPRFKFIPALSEPEPDDKWQGATGLITEVLDSYLESGDNLEAYLCGSPGMIDACVNVLTKNGVPEDLIFYDKFA